MESVRLPTPAQDDAPRTTVGTVLGTVPGVIPKGVLAGVCGWVFPAILRAICSATCGLFGKGVRRRTLAAIRNPTFRPIRVATRRLICGAICRGISRGVSMATSTASCGLRDTSYELRVSSYALGRREAEDGRAKTNGESRVTRDNYELRVASQGLRAGRAGWTRPGPRSIIWAA
jgi:hypothetical protein